MATPARDLPEGTEQFAQRAHTWVGHFESLVTAAKADLEKFVPASLVGDVEDEIKQLAHQALEGPQG